MTKVFVDADVILDLFIDREPHHSVAMRFFSYADANAASIALYTSPVVIANVAYLLGRAKSHAYAVDRLARLRQFVGVLPMGESVIDDAIRRPGGEFEDSLQYHCARANELTVIITRNVKDFITDSVQIMTPSEFLTVDFMEKST